MTHLLSCSATWRRWSDRSAVPETSTWWHRRWAAVTRFDL